VPLFPIFTATRYVTPLREGGSLPAIIDTENDGLFVVKFRGAGQGAKALIAELLVGQLARAAGLPVPELALIDILPLFGRSEPDPEIQELLRASHGINVGLRYLDGAFNFDVSAAGEFISPELASRIVWFDAFVTNPDRTARNPNLLIWNRQPWLIDHGAALYVHHDWDSVDEQRERAPFSRIRDHVLLTRASELQRADEYMSHALSEEVITDIIQELPEALIADPVSGYSMAPDEIRTRYRRYLINRIRSPRAFVTEAQQLREQVLREPPRPLLARR
jgi:hypothetical protein